MEYLDVPSPSFSTTPAPSAPSTIGNVAGIGFHAPEASKRSMGFMPAARSLIRICRAPGSGVGISATAGVPPYSLTVIARIRVLLTFVGWITPGATRVGRRPGAGTPAYLRGRSGSSQTDLGAQPRAHLRDRRVDLWNPAGPQEEGVLPLGQRAQLQVDAGRAGPLGELLGIVDEELVLAIVDHRRRQPCRLRVRQVDPRIGDGDPSAVQHGVGEPAQQVATEHLVEACVGVDRLVLQLHVEPRRDG